LLYASLSVGRRRACANPAMSQGRGLWPPAPDLVGLWLPTSTPRRRHPADMRLMPEMPYPARGGHRNLPHPRPGQIGRENGRRVYRILPALWVIRWIGRRANPPPGSSQVSSGNGDSPARKRRGAREAGSRGAEGSGTDNGHSRRHARAVPGRRLAELLPSRR
jgi:hypothetical protein